MRNRLLNGRGTANRVLGQFIKLQTDFGLQVGSEERVHFRTLSKRTRERLLARSDEHNNFAAKKAEKELKKVKHQKTQDKETYERRCLRVEEQGAAAQLRNKTEHEGNLVYWQLKAEGLQDKMKTMKVHPNPTHPLHLFLTTTFTLNLTNPNPDPNPNPNPNLTGRVPWQTQRRNREVKCKS